MTTTQIIASVLGVLSLGGLAGCNMREKQATEVPAGAAEPTKPCLHTEGCCGGHKPGDGSCGAGKPDTANATAGDADPDAPAGVVAQRFEWSIEPGKFAEINLELGDGAKMSASFESDAPLAWNVHSHPGDTPVIHAEGSDAKGAPAFAADKGGLYSYLWANKSKQAVKLTVELRIDGTGRVHSTHP